MIPCKDATCGRFAPGGPFVRGEHCPLCHAAAHSPAVAHGLGRGPRPPGPPAPEPRPRPRPLPARLPCVYEGPVREPCLSCGGRGNPARDVRWCTHPTADRDACTRGRVSDRVQSCAACPDYQPPAAAGHPVTPDTPDALLAGLIREPPPPGGWPRGWQTWPNARRVHQQAAREFAAAVGPYPADRFTGRGVVIAAGGAYWPGAYVCVRMLRETGCTLPVQVWYLGGRGERDERYERLLAPLGAACVDADAHPARAARRIVNGFEVKLFAVLHSPFREALYLDADAYPCADVTPAFEDPRYKAAGGVYWPDLPKTDRWTNWEHWGVTPRGPCGLETGVYLVDKAACWDVLRLAEWYDDHSDWCYGAGGFSDHGDKGPHRVAWAFHRRDYAMFATKADWRSVAFVQPGPDGAPLVVHRCRSKFTVGGGKFVTTSQNGVNLRAGLPGEAAAFAALDDLRRVLAGRPSAGHG